MLKDDNKQSSTRTLKSFDFFVLGTSSWGFVFSNPFLDVNTEVDKVMSKIDRFLWEYLTPS